MVFSSGILSVVYYYVSPGGGKQVIVAIITGIIASSIITLIVEISENYAKNNSRMMIMDDYLTCVTEYESRIESYCTILKDKIYDDNHGPIDLIELEKHANEIDDGNVFHIKEIHELDGVYFQAVAYHIMNNSELLENTLKTHSNLLYPKEIDCLQDMIVAVHTCKLHSNAIYHEEIEEWTNDQEKHEQNRISSLLHKIELDRVKYNLQNELFNEMLSDLTKIEKENLIGIVYALITYDMGMKKLKRGIIGEKDLEYRQLRNHLKNIKNF